MEAQARRGIWQGGRTGRTSPFSRARPAAQPHSAPAARPWDACATAALLHFSSAAYYSHYSRTPDRESQTGVPSSRGGSSPVASLREQKRDTGSSRGDLRDLPSPPPRFLPDQRPDWSLPNSVAQWDSYSLLRH